MYKDKEKQKEYQRNWISKRRQNWFDENGPCVLCGSWKKLELHHIDPKTKESHNIWGWSEERRNKELKKCQVLCGVCHQKKTSEYRKVCLIGKHNWKCCKLNPEQLKNMREYRKTHTNRETGEKFKIHYSRVYRLDYD